MGTIRIESQSSSRFFCYQMSSQEQLDSVVKGMLDYNRIPGILQPIFSQMDDDVFFRYDITPYISFRDLLHGGIRLRTMIKIMLGIASALDQSQEYLIPGNAFLMETDCIFVNGKTYDVGLICLPVLRSESGFSSNEFFLDLLTRNRVNTEQHAEYYPEIINYLNDHRNHLVLRDFCDLLQKYWDEILVMEGKGSPQTRNAGSKPVDAVPQFAPVVPNTPTTPPDETMSKSKPNSMYADVIQAEEGVLAGKEPKKKFGFGAKTKEPKPGKPVKEPKAPKPGKPALPIQTKPKSEKLSFLEKKEKKEEKKSKKENKPAPVGGLIPGKENVARTAEPQPRQAEYQPPEPIAAAVTGGSNRQQQGVSFGETVFLSGQNEGTQMLDSVRRNPEAPVFRLIRSANGEIVNIDQTVLRIGRDRDYADYCIRNEFVSSQHARLELRNNECLLIDTNSSNGTFINGQQLVPYETRVLNDGDTVVFGDEEFVFHSR